MLFKMIFEESFDFLNEISIKFIEVMKNTMISPSKARIDSLQIIEDNFFNILEFLESRDQRSFALGIL